MCYLSWNLNVGECATGKGKMTFDVFADNWLFVMTSNIVPFDSISIKVVKYGKTGLFSTVLLDIFSVIGLGSWWAESVNDKNKNEYTLLDIFEPFKPSSH